MVRGLLVVALLSGCAHRSKDPGGLPPAQDWGTSAAASAGPTSAPDAGVDASHAVDVSSMGLPAPDPNRPIDPSHHVAGVIQLRGRAAGKARPGTAVFVLVKQADTTGEPAGPPLAVVKLTWPASDQLPFRLTEADAMIPGTGLAGKVVIIARYDQDGDALTKQPGDLLGQARATAPADHITLYLDQVQ